MAANMVPNDTYQRPDLSVRFSLILFLLLLLISCSFLLDINVVLQTTVKARGFVFGDWDY